MSELNVSMLKILAPKPGVRGSKAPLGIDVASRVETSWAQRMKMRLYFTCFD